MFLGNFRNLGRPCQGCQGPEGGVVLGDDCRMPLQRLCYFMYVVIMLVYVGKIIIVEVLCNIPMCKDMVMGYIAVCMLVDIVVVVACTLQQR